MLLFACGADLLDLDAVRSCSRLGIRAATAERLPPHFELLRAFIVARLGLLDPFHVIFEARLLGANLLARLPTLLALLLTFVAGFLPVFAVAAIILGQGRRSRDAGEKDGDQQFTHDSDSLVNCSEIAPRRLSHG